MRLVLALLILTFVPFGAALADGDPAAGEKVYKQFCKRCHEPIPGDPLAAPSLKGIVDRPIAAAEDYRYSDAFLAKKAEGMIWDEQNLRDFMRHPRGFIPGSVMVFTGVKRAQHRDDLFAYLKGLK